jgi:taurine dioxygenase
VLSRHVYRHYWSVGEVVMWDNRCLTHLAVGDYDPSESRYMIRTSGKGEYVGRLEDEPPVAGAKPVPRSREVAAAVDALRD